MVTLVRSVVDAMTMIAKLMVNSSTSLIVASLDKIFLDYFCLVESNKQQIKEIRSRSHLENKGDSSESEFVLCLVPPSLSRDRRIRNHHSLASITIDTQTCVVRHFASLGFFPFFVVLGPPISFNFI